MDVIFPQPHTDNIKFLREPFNITDCYNITFLATIMDIILIFFCLRKIGIPLTGLHIICQTEI
ncbi:unknown [Prevotella sp. CAG:1320]|nr:unknown [Prevotella sp. CAG:1320]